jgi:23S rRNA-/tRNA-specific pseudouridylate synthase
VEGRFEPDSATLRSHLAENAALRVFATEDPRRGRLAVTHVRVVRRSASRTLVEVRLETGRKHQIRVQLAASGHPIVGDRRYGRHRPGTRLMLHAARLRLRHPESGTEMEFRSRLPAGLRTALAAEG